MDLKEFLEKGDQHHIPQLSVDIVIVGYEQGQLKCLLLQIGDKWLLPGGFIKNNESVETAASRVLFERTGLEDQHLKFLSVFGNGNRQFNKEWEHFFEKIGANWNENYWLNKRFVSLTYYSLVNLETTHPKVDGYHQGIQWFNFDKLPEIWMDHKEIVLEARNRIKQDTKSELISYNLLPDQFTMPELHQLHQVILEEDLDRSRFQKKMLSSGIFERLPKLRKETPGRNPYLYRVKA